MTESRALDERFREAVAAIDAGDTASVARIISADPALVRERLSAPGAWLSDRVGDALQGFFQDPYLLWFVAEDPVRNGVLAPTIAAVSQALIDGARREAPDLLSEQVAYALRLVCWSTVARACGVQIALIDVLVDAGASTDGRSVYGSRFGTHAESAIYNGNFDAAEHLLARGAPITLSSALCLGRWDDVERLTSASTPEEKADAFVLAALNGIAAALSRMLTLGVDPTTVSSRNQSHASALHHAVWSGHLDAVKILVEAGADRTLRDTIYHGTPLTWAEHGVRQGAGRATAYAAIADYLRSVETRA